MEKTSISEKDVKVEINGNRGFAASKANVVTFEIQGIAEREDITRSEYRSLYSRYTTERMTVRLDDLEVPYWGEGHNLYPQEVYSITSDNKLLPELIEKQVDFLFGKGPRFYQEQVVGEGDKKRRVRIPWVDGKAQNWLDSWEEKGYPHYWEYLKNIITDYYLVKTCVSKYNFNKGRRIDMPVAIDALTYVGADEARLAARGNFINRRIKNEDCKFVVVGDWLNISSHQYDVYPRFDAAAPTKYPVSVAFVSDKTFSKWVYAYNEWFKGLYEWIKASNLSPRYLNSYLKNALNSHVHVVIPALWYQAQKSILENICMNNLAGDTDIPVQTEYRGVKLIDDSGKPFRFFDTMMEDLVANELRRITSMMSGEGKNQGKAYATIKYGEEGWEFKDMPGKFKEYMEAVITFDKRADQVILAGKGISSSITNVENDGVISKSGSDVYYNYLLYVMSLTLDEYFIMKEINRALWINFPYLKTQGVKLGLWIEIPEKLQETTPADRPGNTATSDPVKPQTQN